MVFLLLIIVLFRSIHAEIESHGGFKVQCFSAKIPAIFQTEIDMGLPFGDFQGGFRPFG
jgi:hypothetical protein